MELSFFFFFEWCCAVLGKGDRGEGLRSSAVSPLASVSDKH